MNRDVLEQNVARLLTTSWRPLVPSARFVEGLRDRMEREIRNGAGSRSLLARTSPRLRIAASILLMLVGMACAWFLRRDDSTAVNAESLVGQGCVAVRIDGVWRAASEHELAHGLDVGARDADVATATDAGFTLHLGSAGRVEVEPRSTASVTTQGVSTAEPVEPVSRGEPVPRGKPDGQARTIEVAGQGASIRRDDSGAPWIVRTKDASIALERGVLRWTQAPGGPLGAQSYVELAVGRAWVADDPTNLLALGQRAWLADGRVVAAAVILSDAPRHGPARRAGVSEDVSTAAEPTVAALVNVSGTLAFPTGIEPPPSFRLTLLRHVALPDVSEPETTVFAGRTAVFALENVRAGLYDVFVEAQGCAVARQLGVDIQLERATVLAFELQPARRVSGHVHDAETGAPIANAAVVAETMLPAQVVPFDVDVETAGWLAATRTDADGAFVLEGLDLGELELRITAAGRAARWIRAQTSDSTADLGTIELQRGGAVRGRVSRSDGSAWRRAIVIASRLGSGTLGERMSFATTQSDADGIYSITDLPPGGYVVFAIDPAVGVTPATRELTIRGTEVVEKDLGPSERRTRVVGIVRDAAGQPLPAMDLMLGHDDDVGGDVSGDVTTWISTRTIADGSFAIEGVEPRKYTLFVGRGLGTSFAIVGELNVPLAPEIRHDVTLAPGSIRARVLAIDGTPAKEAWIILLRGAKDDFAGRARTDASGFVEVLGLEPDLYAITAHDVRPGVAAVRADAIDVRTEPRDVTLTFVPGVELRVRVVDANGTPRAGVRVRFTDELGVKWQFSAESTTRTDGVLVVPGARPGRWRVAVDGAAEQEFDLEIGPRRELEFETIDDNRKEVRR